MIKRLVPCSEARFGQYKINPSSSIIIIIIIISFSFQHCQNRNTHKQRGKRWSDDRETVKRLRHSPFIFHFDRSRPLISPNVHPVGAPVSPKYPRSRWCSDPFSTLVISSRVHNMLTTCKVQLTSFVGHTQRSAIQYPPCFLPGLGQEPASIAESAWKDPEERTVG